MPSYTELNVNLVEAFGNLEQLCSQMYNEQYGVTCYINDMKNSYDGSLSVTNWNTDILSKNFIREDSQEACETQESHGILLG